MLPCPSGSVSGGRGFLPPPLGGPLIGCRGAVVPGSGGFGGGGN